MAKNDKYSIKDLKAQFGTNEACLAFIFDTLHNRKCSCGGLYSKVKDRLQYQCSKCRYQIAPLAGTIFEKTSTPLVMWFHALFIFSNAKSGVSAKEMERQLGVTYKTAWRILTLIRKSLKQKTRHLRGDVEMDETYFGGRVKAGQNNKNLSAAMKKKSVIIGAVERKGLMRASVSPNARAKTIARFLDYNVNPIGTTLLTDESNRYDNSTWGYDRLKVNHSQKEYVRGNVHVNSIEGFWGHFKRSVTGTHKVISHKHLQSYLDGFVFHYNNRHNDKLRFSALRGALLSV